MKKRILAAAMAAAMAMSLCACGSTTSSTAESSATDASTAESSAAADTSSTEDTAAAVTSTDKFSFTLTSHDPDTTAESQMLQAWCDKVNEVTNGNVTITPMWSATLASAADAGDMVKNQGADIGWLYDGYYTGQYPLCEVLNLPMQGFGDPVVSTEVLWDLSEGDYPDVMQQWANDYKVLMFYGNPGMMICANTEITSLADLKGLSLRCPGGAITDVMTAWGASPISMTPPDIYQAVEKNNIQGYIFEPSGICNFSLQEVTQYCLDYQMYDAAFCLAMNWDKWNSMPADYQAAIDAISGYDASINAAQVFVDDVAEKRDTMSAAGVTFLTVSDDMLAEMQVAADAYAETWAASVEGVDGAAFLQAAKDLAAKYQ